MFDWIGLLGPTAAHAQTAVSGSAAFMTSFAPFLLIFVIFYFLLIRPQQKRQKNHRSMLEELKKGDKIITNGGLLGTISTVNKEILIVQVSDQVRVRVLRSEVMDLQSEVLSSGGKDQKDSAKG